jgi:hypothetical protein
MKIMKIRNPNQEISLTWLTANKAFYKLDRLSSQSEFSSPLFPKQVRRARKAVKEGGGCFLEQVRGARTAVEGSSGGQWRREEGR